MFEGLIAEGRIHFYCDLWAGQSTWKISRIIVSNNDGSFYIQLANNFGQVLNFDRAPSGKAS